MILEHASYAYPSHLLLFVELGVGLVAALALFLMSRRGSPFIARVWAVFERAARRPGGAAAVLFMMGFAGNGLTHVVLEPPVATVTDENAYLLGASTFSLGRWTNPSPELPETVRVHHVLDQPTRQSKFPPAQSLFLALGQVAQVPWLSLAIGAGLLGMIGFWALRPWVGGEWALSGGLLMMLRPGIGTYWNQSWWGGTVAALGGALLLGAVGRWRQQARHATGPTMVLALPLALGASILATSRPYEGLLFSLVCAVGLLPALVEGTKTRLEALRTLVVAGVGLALALGVLAQFHQAVVGDWATFPHALYTVERTPDFGHFAWTHPETKEKWGWGISPRTAATNVAFTLQFLLSWLLAPCAIWGAFRVPLVRIPALACGLVFAGHLVFVVPWHVHYIAPAAAGVVLLAMAGAESLGERVPDLGRGAVLVTLVIFASMTLLELPAHRADPDHVTRLRLRAEEVLKEIPGRDLVLVDALPPRDEYWVVNEPRLEQAEVLWARDLDPETTGRLLEVEADRLVWLLEDGVEEVRLVPDDVRSDRRVIGLWPPE